MIRNERQYRITKSEADKFEQAVSQLDHEVAADTHPLLLKAQRDALLSQLADLRADVEEYDALKAGKRALLELDSLADLPDALVKARIAAGLSHKELADRLGMKEQQIQRYEASDYSGANLSRLIEIARAIGIDVQQSLFLPTSLDAGAEMSKRLKDIGFDQDFVRTRLLPRDAADRAEPADIVFHTTAALSRILGLTPAALLGTQGPAIDPSAYLAARFKVPASAEPKKLMAYTVYAHFLALLLLEATDHLPQAEIPRDAESLRRAVVDRFGELTLASVLRYAWHMGIPVLPLKDPGAFHAACWRVGGRNVIVLKQRAGSLGRWLFDLLHELCHATEEPGNAEFQVIEGGLDAIGASSNPQPSELQANLFAGNVVLAGRAEELAQRAVEMTKKTAAEPGRLQLLKKAVLSLASQENVPVDALANYLAYRLALQGENWWGAAMNLQDTDDNPWSIARDVLLEQTRFHKLNSLDRRLLTQALRE